jgi:hypothetical protein
LLREISRAGGFRTTSSGGDTGSDEARASEPQPEQAAEESGGQVEPQQADAPAEEPQAAPEPAPEPQPVADEPANYEEWTVEELKAEIRSRNRSRATGDHLPVTGSKTELVSVLAADGAQ